MYRSYVATSATVQPPIRRLLWEALGVSSPQLTHFNKRLADKFPANSNNYIGFIISDTLKNQIEPHLLTNDKKLEERSIENNEFPIIVIADEEPYPTHLAPVSDYTIDTQFNLTSDKLEITNQARSVVDNEITIEQIPNQNTTTELLEQTADTGQQFKTEYIEHKSILTTTRNPIKLT